MYEIIWKDPMMFKVVGWSLIHSFWQGLTLLLICKLILWIVDKANSKIRYSLTLGIFFSIVVCTIFTFAYEYKQFHKSSNYVEGSSVAQISEKSPQEIPLEIAVSAATPISIVTKMTHLFSSMIPYLTIYWLIGMIFFSAKLLFGGVALNGYRKLTSESTARYIDIVRNLAEKMGIKEEIRLIISKKVNQPFTFGYLKPIILLPLSYVSSVPVSELEMILAHELAHIKRFDYVVNLAQSVIEIIYFFNPFVQSISKITRLEREFCCDDMASKFCGNEKDMAIALANLRVVTSQARLSLAANATTKSLHKRIFRLLKPTSDGKFSITGAVLTFIFLSGLTVFLANCGDAKNSKPALVQSDSIVQLYTDNQADHKFQVFDYFAENKRHEVVLISTLEGKPLYAYFDGVTATQAELDTIYNTIERHRTLSDEDLARMKPSVKELRTKRLHLLNHEVDSLGKIVTEMESNKLKHADPDSREKLNSLKKDLDSKINEIKSLSMEGYKEEVANIPVAVKMHELITNIITKKEYTPDERNQLNELIRKRQ